MHEQIFQSYQLQRAVLMDDWPLNWSTSWWNRETKCEGYKMLNDTNPPCISQIENATIDSYESYTIPIAILNVPRKNYKPRFDQVPFLGRCTK